MRSGMKTISIIVMSLLLFVGTARAKQEYSGFLVDYSQLKPGPQGGVAKVYRKEGVNFNKYSKIMMDHVVFFFKDDAQEKGIDPIDMAELSHKFHKEARAALGSAYPFVENPGPDVMRVRVAITDLELPKRTPGMLKSIMTGKGPGLGEISMEFEFLDSETNQRIMAGVDHRTGTRLESLRRFATAEDAFKFWAQRLRLRMDEARGNKK
jgi:hypothetical protein